MFATRVPLCVTQPLVLLKTLHFNIRVKKNAQLYKWAMHAIHCQDYVYLTFESMHLGKRIVTARRRSTSVWMVQTQKPTATAFQCAWKLMTQRKKRTTEIG